MRIVQTTDRYDNDSNQCVVKTITNHNKKFQKYRTQNNIFILVLTIVLLRMKRYRNLRTSELC